MTPTTSVRTCRWILQHVSLLLLMLLIRDAALAGEHELSEEEGAKIENQAFTILRNNPSPAQRKKAMELLAKAAEGGMLASQYYYGAELLTHEGNKEDVAHGVALLDRCARSSSVSCQYWLGWHDLRTGDDAVQAVGLNWIEAAAAQEDPPSLLSLGGIYARGYRSIQRDTAKATLILRRAMQLGQPEQRAQAAWSLLRTTQDEDLKRKSVYVMEQAAPESGRASYWLAHEYLTGAFVAKDYQIAARWLQKGSELKFQPSTLWLSQLYMKGMGVKSDPARAQKMLQTSLAAVSVADKNEFAWELATLPDPALRNGQVAVDVMEHALTSTANRIPQYIDTLAAAYAEVGNYDQAVRTQREAIAKLPSSNRHAAPEVYQQHLDAFMHRQPIREAR